MRIVLLTIGGRGDTQPFVALAIRLKQEGHHVTLADRPDFADLAAEYGVEFAPLGHPYQPFITGAAASSALGGGHLLNQLRYGLSQSGGMFLTNSIRMPGARRRAQTRSSTNIVGSPATASRKNWAFRVPPPCSFR